MIRHTAVEALYANAFAADEDEPRLTERKPDMFGESGNSRTSIAALIRIICNSSNSSSLRATACECLGEHVSTSPELGAYAAGELFARRESGAAAEYVFDALLQLVRETPFTNGKLFHDAVEALSGVSREIRFAAAERFAKTLAHQDVPAPLFITARVPALVVKSFARRA